MNLFKLSVVVLGLALAAGCVKRSEISAAGQRFVLAEEPSGAQGILDYRESKPEPGRLADRPRGLGTAEVVEPIGDVRDHRSI